MGKNWLRSAMAICRGTQTCRDAQQHVSGNGPRLKKLTKILARNSPSTVDSYL
jgi:hypothetical protein